MSFIILLLQLGLVGFTRVSRAAVSVRIRVRFSFTVRVGRGLPNVECLELCVGNQTCRCRHSLKYNIANVLSIYCCNPEPFFRRKLQCWRCW